MAQHRISLVQLFQKWIFLFLPGVICTGNPVATFVFFMTLAYSVVVSLRSSGREHLGRAVAVRVSSDCTGQTRINERAKEGTKERTKSKTKTKLGISERVPPEVDTRSISPFSIPTTTTQTPSVGEKAKSKRDKKSRRKSEDTERREKKTSSEKARREAERAKREEDALREKLLREDAARKKAKRLEEFARSRRAEEASRVKAKRAREKAKRKAETLASAEARKKALASAEAREKAKWEGANARGLVPRKAKPADDAVEQASVEKWMGQRDSDPRPPDRKKEKDTRAKTSGENRQVRPVVILAKPSTHPKNAWADRERTQTAKAQQPREPNRAVRGPRPSRPAQLQIETEKTIPFCDFVNPSGATPKKFASALRNQKTPRAGWQFNMACEFFDIGGCKNGDKCQFRHPSDQGRVVRRKREHASNGTIGAPVRCKFAECTRSDCWFWHPRDTSTFVDPASVLQNGKTNPHYVERHVPVQRPVPPTGERIPQHAISAGSSTDKSPATPAFGTFEPNNSATAKASQWSSRSAELKPYARVITPPAFRLGPPGMRRKSVPNVRPVTRSIHGQSKSEERSAVISSEERSLSPIGIRHANLRDSSDPKEPLASPKTDASENSPKAWSPFDWNNAKDKATTSESTLWGSKGMFFGLGRKDEEKTKEIVTPTTQLGRVTGFVDNRDSSLIRSSTWATPNQSTADLTDRWDRNASPVQKPLPGPKNEKLEPEWWEAAKSNTGFFTDKLAEQADKLFSKGV